MVDRPTPQPAQPPPPPPAPPHVPASLSLSLSSSSSSSTATVNNSSSAGLAIATPTTLSARSSPQDPAPPLSSPAPSSATTTPVLEWDVDRVCKWIAELGLAKYTPNFREAHICGTALVALKQRHLIEIGVHSVGHRLRILKSIYNIIEAQGIDAGTDRYIPPTVAYFQQEEARESSAAGVVSGKSSSPTAANVPIPQTPSGPSAELNALPHIIELFVMRDERISVLETEVRSLFDNYAKLSENYAKLREELLPIFRMAKESKPLPMPIEGHLNSPSRMSHHQQSISPPLSASISSAAPSPTVYQHSQSTSARQQQQQIPTFPGPPVPTLGPTPQVLHKGLSRRKSASQQHLNTPTSDMHLSPTTSSSQTPGSSAGSQDWLDTSFYGSNGVAQPAFITTSAPSNNLITTTIITQAHLPSTSGTGKNTPVSIPGSATSSLFPSSSDENDYDDRLLVHSSNSSSAVHLSVSTPTSASSSKKLQIPQGAAAAAVASQFYTGSASPSPSFQTAQQSKPPLSHSTSLPHPGSHDDYYDTHDMRSAGLAPKTSYMSLATASSGNRPSVLISASSGQLSANTIPSSASGSNSGGGPQTPRSMGYPSSYIHGYSSHTHGHSHAGTPQGTPGIHEFDSEGTLIPHGMPMTPVVPSGNSPISGSSTANGGGGASSISSSSSRNGTEPIKDFNIPPDVPCYKVLPVIAKKHKVRSDKVELVVCYDDQERMIGLEELPLKIFKELDAQGKNPIFMIRESTGVKTNEGFVVNGTPGGLF